MKPKTMILMAVAVVCGLAASYLASILLTKQQEKIVVLVAKEKLARWTPIRNVEEKFARQEILLTDKPNNAVTMDKEKEVVNRMLIKNLDQGAVLTFDDLQSKDKGGLETELSPGMVAVAVRISADTAAGGFVLPGSRVNVVHQTRDNKGGEAKILLENVLVKAVDLLPVRPEDRPGMVGATATLEVSPQDGLKLMAAQGSGTIMLQLRPYNDQTKIAEKEPDPSDFPLPPPPPPEKKAEPQTQAATATPEEKKPVEEEHVTTVTNGNKVYQRVYRIKDAKVVSSEIRQLPDVQAEKIP